MQLGEALAGLVLGPWAGSRRVGAEELASVCSRAWQVLEIALSDDAFWDRLTALLPGDEARRLVRPAREQCDALPPELMPLQGEARRRCLRDLWRARQAGLLDPHPPSAEGLAGFADPSRRADAERAAVAVLAGEFVSAGCPTLAELLTAGPELPLPVRAARWPLGQDEWPFLAALRPLLDGFGDAVAAALAEAQSAGEGELPEALDLFAEWRAGGGKHREAYGAVWDAQRRLGLLGPRPRVEVGADEGGRQAVRRAVAGYRALSPAERKSRPALLYAVGKLQLAVGDFRPAARDFAAVLALAREDAVKAEAHAALCRAALGAGEPEKALRSLLQAVRVGGGRHAPFPLDSLPPQGILSHDALGMTFLCRPRAGGGLVMVRALGGRGPGRDVAAILAVAERVRPLGHPGLLLPRDGGFADPAAKARPYLVLDNFPGTTLRDHVREHGTMLPEDVLDVALQLAEALQVLHRLQVVHGAVGPSCVLVRPPASRTGWEVKLTDVGVAAAADPAEDVKGFGRACCFALVGTSAPSAAQWARVPGTWAELLRRCLAEGGERPPSDFEPILRCLKRMSPPPEPAPPAPKPRPEPAARRSPPPAPVEDAPPPPRTERRKRSASLREVRKSAGVPWWLWLVGGGVVASLAVVGFLLVVLLLSVGPPSTQPAQPAAGAPANNPLVGSWRGWVDGCEEVVTVRNDLGVWSVTGAYFRNGVRVGGFNSTNVRLAGRSLTFVQHFDRVPPGLNWVDGATVDLSPGIDGQIYYTWHIPPSRQGTRSLIAVR